MSHRPKTYVNTIAHLKSVHARWRTDEARQVPVELAELIPDVVAEYEEMVQNLATVNRRFSEMNRAQTMLKMRAESVPELKVVGKELVRVLRRQADLTCSAPRFVGDQWINCACCSACEANRAISAFNEILYRLGV